MFLCKVNDDDDDYGDDDNNTNWQNASIAVELDGVSLGMLLIHADNLPVSQ